MANNPSLISSRQNTPSLVPWTLFFLASLAMLSVFSSLVLKNFGLVVLIGMILLSILLPILLRCERFFLWMLLVLFPAMYYDPIRLGGLIFGAQNTGVVVPLFFLGATPGALFALFSRQKIYKRLLPITLPIWLILAGFCMSALRFTHLFHPEYLLRDALGLIIDLYLLTVIWKMLKENPDRNYRLLFRILYGIGICNALAIIAERALHFGLVEAGGFIRPMGLFGFPIQASFISCLTLVLSLNGFFTAQSRSERAGFGFGVLILLFGAVMSLTKTGIVQLVPILLLWGIFIPRHLRIRALVFTVITFILLALWETFFDQGQLIDVLVSRFSTSDTFQIRENAWKIVLSSLTLKGLIFGNGWLSSSELLGIHNYNYGLFPVDLSSKLGPFAIHAHNALIKYTYELGLLGVAMVCSYIGMVILGFYRLIKCQDIHLKIANLTMATLVISLLIASTTGIPMAENYMLLFFSVATLLIGYSAKWISLSD